MDADADVGLAVTGTAGAADTGEEMALEMPVTVCGKINAESEVSWCAVCDPDMGPSLRISVSLTSSASQPLSPLSSGTVGTTVFAHLLAF